jgi:hypothetical protein
MLGDERVGAALRTRAHARTVFVHAGGRTDPDGAVEVGLLDTDRGRTPASPSSPPAGEGVTCPRRGSRRSARRWVARYGDRPRHGPVGPRYGWPRR